MKKILIILNVLLLASYNGFGQSNNSLSGLDYKDVLKTHIDSFYNIVKIEQGKVFLNSDTLNLKKIFPECYYDYESRYPDQIVSYILKDSNDSLAVLFFFYENRLIEFALLMKGSLLINNSNIYIERSFKSSKIDVSYSLMLDSIIRSGDRITSYSPIISSKYLEGNNKTLEFEFYENFLNDVAILRIGDKKALSMLPSWCGIDSKRNKLVKYLRK